MAVALSNFGLLNRRLQLPVFIPGLFADSAAVTAYLTPLIDEANAAYPTNDVLAAEYVRQNAYEYVNLFLIQRYGKKKIKEGDSEFETDGNALLSQFSQYQNDAQVAFNVANGTYGAPALQEWCVDYQVDNDPN